MSNDKEFRKDHVSAELYFTLRNALWMIGQDELTAIVKQALQDESDNAKQHA